MSSQFSLRWNNYINHITYAFESLRSHEDLVDVTLCCEGRKIRAHKILLSACSIYFKDVFKENPCQHPVIIFKNVKYEDLLSIIEFMYQGEVNVQQESLSSFLNTAEMLSVQGLTDTTNPDTLLLKDNLTSQSVPQGTKTPKLQTDIKSVSMTTQTYPIVTQNQTNEFILTKPTNIVIKSRTFSEKTDNTDFAPNKKRRISDETEHVDEDDNQNVDDDIYEECGDGDGELQQTDNVMNDEYRRRNHLIFNDSNNDTNRKIPDTNMEWTNVETNYFLDIYEDNIKCLDNQDTKKKLWLNISFSMYDIGYFRSANDCCEKWKNLCRNFQKLQLSDDYIAARVKYLLNEVVNNSYANDTYELKILGPTSWHQQNEYFEIMV